MKIAFDVNVRVTAAGIGKIAAALESIADSFDRLATVAERVVGPVPARGLRFETTGERLDPETMKHFISYKLTWPKLTADVDVSAQELTISVDGIPKQPELLSKFTSEFDGEELLESVILAELVNIDAQGNRQKGPPATVEGQLGDTFPPPDAGTLTIETTGERLEPEAGDDGAPAVNPQATGRREPLNPDDVDKV